ncbi:acyltransferase-domain-containing protein [Dacryopinax primogenitus]|uniref:Tafazzin family protein n=1 Tax=Dacryopinax primogenitus (strain DJM 731) TaxID=1858805 RepID=M5G3B8_DACPD|nr:acyltransferase-domain-containing protein [Dacryopinax primogenitus]EJT98252.1 acyltransferase-domain-containing protein [Dacryopinax primogenitus]
MKYLQISSCTVGAVGLLCKAFLRWGCKEVKVEGLDVLVKALEDKSRRDNGTGILTVCNHISVLDDPLIWGVMPTYTYFDPNLSRWTLGASDIIFTNPLFGVFFRTGQVFETFRGGGIYQTAVDDAIRTLDDGRWIHIYPEGKINQPCYNPAGGLFPFKWGMGRMIMEAKSMPIIIPMWITGTDQVMPEPRYFPNKFPVPGNRLSITFSHDPKLNDAVGDIRAQWLARGRPEAETANTRSRVTARIKDSVQALRNRIQAASSTR